MRKTINSEGFVIDERISIQRDDPEFKRLAFLAQANKLISDREFAMRAIVTQEGARIANSIKSNIDFLPLQSRIVGVALKLMDWVLNDISGPFRIDIDVMWWAWVKKDPVTGELSVEITIHGAHATCDKEISK